MQQIFCIFKKLLFTPYNFFNSFWNWLWVKENEKVKIYTKYYYLNKNKGGNLIIFSVILNLEKGIGMLLDIRLCLDDLNIITHIKICIGTQLQHFVIKAVEKKFIAFEELYHTCMNGNIFYFIHSQPLPIITHSQTGANYIMGQGGPRSTRLFRLIE